MNQSEHSQSSDCDAMIELLADLLVEDALCSESEELKRDTGENRD